MNKRGFRIFILGIVISSIPFNGFSQVLDSVDLNKASDEQKIEAGELYFESKQFKHSLMAWKSLLKDFPDNPRLNYMAGQCLLSIRGEKENALEYLEKVKSSIGYKTKMKGANHTDIPLDGYFYLGQAQLHRLKFEDAMVSFNEYLVRGGNNLSEPEKKDAERWIQWCVNAKANTDEPDISITITNMGDVINSQADEYSPVISLDENVLYFTTRRLRKDHSNKGVISDETGTYYEDVYVSYRDKNGKWSAPKFINFQGHDADENEATVSVSADGSIVYVYMDRDGGGDLYLSSFVGDDDFSQPENLANEICTASWETHCSLTPDGNVLFFASNRPGGQGGLDIYRVIRLPNGQWSKAEALPPTINTPYDEDAPFIHPSGNVLYYSSNGPASMGEYDIFRARITEQQPLTFAEPIDLGSPINTVDNDMFLVLDPSGKRGYYSSSQHGIIGGQDLFMIEFGEPESEPFAILKGFVMMVDGSKIPDNININITDITNDNQQLNFKPRRVDGGFVMSLKPCNEYEIQYFKGEEEIKTDKFTVPCKSGYQEIYKELYIDTLFLAVDIPTETNVNDKKTEVETIVKDKPLYFEKYYGYNESGAGTDEQWKKFMEDIKKRLAQYGTVKVKIESSASFVPTTTYVVNSRLATLRAAAMKETITKTLKEQQLDVSKISFAQPKSLVQGPVYKNDYETNAGAYQKYQYVKVWVE
ncbi:MAG: hypothetical protein ACHQF2_03200 [Flavobacteriales bacterium]